MPISWQLRKGRGGRKKKIPTERYFCPNKSCEYYAITEEAIHALVGYGVHGTNEVIQDFKCQAFGKKFTSRRDTILYRLRTHSGLLEKIVWLLALGVDASALEEVFGVREITIRTWLCRSRMQGKKLHERILVELELVHVQLDEAFDVAKRWAYIRRGSQCKHFLNEVFSCKTPASCALMITWTWSSPPLLVWPRYYLPS
jgi:transposase-like protein